MDTDEIKYAVFTPGKETVITSWAKDLMSAATLGFLVYISHGSTWWTFFCGGIALLWIIGKAKTVLGMQKRFRTKEELQAWVDSLENAIDDDSPRNEA